MKKYFYFLYLAFFFFGCDDPHGTSTSRNLRLRHGGADMPIWVRGNLASNKLLLFLHGGPGDCAMCYRHYLQGIESEFAVAYWDQRLAGSSSGRVDVRTLTYAQFKEDTELVIDLLRQEFPNSQIYLMGHSFGVELGWQYLTDPGHAGNVHGFIAVNGIHSSYRWLYHLREWVVVKAREKEDLSAQSFVEQHPVDPATILQYPWQELYRHMLRIGGNPVSLYSDKKFLAQYAFMSPNLAFAQFTHGKHYGTVTSTDGLLFEKGDALKNVTVPVGLFWGTRDGVVPVAVATEMDALLMNTTREWVRFEQSWHEPFVSETDRFVNETIAFLKRH
jgi:pimeloyl-ACP methyl ester carboxylesterase